MRATLPVDVKNRYPDGFNVQARIWRLPDVSAERPHGLKYSLFYGGPADRLICYDNEAGKGDHRHYRGTETPYLFISLDRLIADFLADVAVERRQI